MQCNAGNHSFYEEYEKVYDSGGTAFPIFLNIVCENCGINKKDVNSL